MGKIDLNPPVGGEIVSALRHCNFMVLRERCTQTAAAAYTLTQKLPAGARVLSIQLSRYSAITMATGTNVSLGDGTDLDEFFESSATMTAGTQEVVEPTSPSQFLAAETSLVLTATNGSGAAAGTWAGTMDVQVFYVTQDALPVA